MQTHGRESMLSDQKQKIRDEPALDRARLTSLALSGSDQAREGRLVNALAARGDERRDTLR